jgi:hypothetical protein
MAGRIVPQNSSSVSKESWSPPAVKVQEGVLV